MKTLAAFGSLALVSFAAGAMLAVAPEEVDYSRISPPALEQGDRAEIMFGGDMLFDRSIRLAMEREGEDYVFSCIAELLRSVDLVVANLEGPITSHPSKSAYSKIGEPDNYTFTFPTTSAELLRRHNIGLVNLGNNHILNFGVAGYEETLHWLDAAGVRYFGDPAAGLQNVVSRIEVGEIPFSFINWNDWGGLTLEETLSLVASEKSSHRIVVVYAHWGEEYVPASARVKRLARQFVDAGAEAVIGSHPHVVQEHELYLPAGRQVGTHIYYSLGNFLFDQYWDEEVRRGLLLKIRFTPTGIERVEEIPIYNQSDRRTCAV